MPEQIPFNIIADVLTKLGSSAVQQIGSAIGVAKELTKLTEKLGTIRGVLVDAEKRQEESDAVKAWVRRLKDVVYDADDLLDDFATHQLQRGVARQVSDFFSSSNQLAFRFEMSNRVKNIKEAVDEIVKEINLLELVQGNIVHGEVDSRRRETHSFVLISEIVGREENKEEIIKSLVSSDNQDKILSMVAIIGFGGLGKTTLAQLVYNDPRVLEYFELKIWVCVSDRFDVKRLVKNILQSINEEDVESLKLDALKDRLHANIRRKRCLLVLDDVWNEDFEKWDQLRTLLMVVGKGSKIIVTTRNNGVASMMGIDSQVSLEGLNKNQSWALFSKLAFKEGQEKALPKLVEIGKEIANMCNGVPLIIKTLGTILHSKTEESHWLSIKNSKNLLSLSAGNDNVLSVLKLSYDDLPIYLKQCFAYCALFPKDYEIEKNMLVQLWMAQGYIQPLDENVGHQYFEELLSRSLLEEFGKDDSNNILSCKMHDLIHDLARTIVGSEVHILEDNAKEISKSVHHVLLFSLLNPKLEALKVKHIRTFLRIGVAYKYKNVSIQSFSSFKCLRVLSLNGFSVKKLPKSLGKLSHLRYLDLSHNEFEVLPNSITRLKNLQTLKLVGCHKLKKFPKDIRELINLRHWENDSYLSYMPCGIGELTILQSLPVFVVGNVGNGRGVGRLSELKELNNLRGELRIKGLENVRDVVESREANLGGKQHIQSLRLIWAHSSGEDAESVLEGLQPHSNLKQLYVEEYGARRFPSWLSSMLLPNLTTVNLKGCSRCQTLSCFVRLPHLKSLCLDHLEKVEYVEYCSSEGSFFPTLQKLSLDRMPNLKGLWKRDLSTHPPPSIPYLSRLEIMRCDKLASLELDSFPLLSQLNIRKCDDLSSLELHSSPLLSELKLLKCPKLTSLLLPSSSSLSRLIISDCDDLASVELHSSPLLSKLDIHSCPKLTTLLLHSSPCLSVLYIFQCPKLTSLLPPSLLLSQLRIEYCGDLASLELQSSPLLSKLIILECPRLTSLLLPPSPHLSQLSITDCDELESVELHSSPLLSELEILKCPRLTSLLLPPSPRLSQLSFTYCDELESVELHSSPLLSWLNIWQCPKLASLLLPPSPCLSKLEIGYCGDLTTLELRSSSCLSMLDIWDCPKLTSLLMPPSPCLLLLRIRNCDELESLELQSSPRLSSLEVFNCPNLTSVHCDELLCLETLELEEVREVVLRQLMLLVTTPSLRSVSIWKMDDLMSLPDELHQHGSTLQTLKIWDCSRLATLPHWIGNLTSLTDLVIWDCPQLTSLPKEMRSLTTLRRLDISDCPHLSERCQ